MKENYKQLTLEDVGVMLPEVEQSMDDDKPIDSVIAKPKQCIHNVEFKSMKRDYVTYCTKCGKILSVHKKSRSRYVKENTNEKCE